MDVSWDVSWEKSISYKCLLGVKHVKQKTWDQKTQLGHRHHFPKHISIFGPCSAAEIFDARLQTYCWIPIYSR